MEGKLPNGREESSRLDDESIPDDNKQDGLTEQDMIDLRSKFNAKTKQDGTTDLSKESFKVLVKQIVEELEGGEAPSAKDLEAAFVLADEDKGGTVDLTEFTNLYIFIKRGEIKGLGSRSINFLAKRRQKKHVKEALVASIEADKERERKHASDLSAKEEAIRLKIEKERMREAAVLRRRDIRAGRETPKPLEAEHALTACFDGTLRVWNLASARVVRDIVGATRSFKPTEEMSQQSQERRQFLQFRDSRRKNCEITCMDVYGQKVIVAGWESAHLWNWHTGEHIKTLPKCHRGWVISVKFAQKGQSVITCGVDKAVTIWTIKNDDFGNDERICRRLVGHRMKVNAIDVFDERIASAGSDGNLKLWDLKTGLILGYDTKTDEKGQAEVLNSWEDSDDTHDDEESRSDSTRSSSSAASYQRSRKNEALVAVKFSRNGSLVLSAGVGGIITCWNGLSGEFIRTFAQQNRRKYDNSFPSALSFFHGNDSGGSVLAGSSDGMIRCWDVQTGVCKFILSGHVKRITSVAVAPGNEIAFSSSEDGTVLVWDLHKADLRQSPFGTSRPNVRTATLNKHGGPVSCVIPVNFEEDPNEYTDDEDEGDLEEERRYEEERKRQMAKREELMSIYEAEKKQTVVAAATDIEDEPKRFGRNPANETENEKSYRENKNEMPAVQQSKATREKPNENNDDDDAEEDEEEEEEEDEEDEED